MDLHDLCDRLFDAFVAHDEYVDTSSIS